MKEKINLKYVRDTIPGAAEGLDQLEQCLIDRFCQSVILTDSQVISCCRYVKKINRDVFVGNTMNMLIKELL